jgi:hypothetical protein
LLAAQTGGKAAAADAEPAISTRWTRAGSLRSDRSAGAKTRCGEGRVRAA